MTATTTKLKGMLFAGEMVRALLNTRIGGPGPIDAALPWKGQTRRLVKPQPELPFFRKLSHIDGAVGGMWTDHGGELVGQMGTSRWARYRPGDVVAVREKWRPSQVPGKAWFASVCGDESHERWRPSIHMPLALAQIHLRITEVRVELLHEISEEDAVAEGCNGWYLPCTPDQGSTDGRTPSEEYQELWDSINPYQPWELNPWVFVYSFERVK